MCTITTCTPTGTNDAKGPVQSVCPPDSRPKFRHGDDSSHGNVTNCGVKKVALHFPLH